MSYKCRILLVEDNDALNRYICSVLVKENYVVKSLTSGANFFKIVDIFKPDIILMDIVLPGTSGNYLVDQLRKEHNNFTPIIFISSYGNFIIDKKEHMLQKPFSSAEMRKKIVSVISKCGLSHSAPDHDPLSNNL